MSDLDIALAPKSDQINADDLIGGEMLVKLTAVKISLNDDQKISISLDGNKKVWRPCKTMGRVMRAAWGDEDKWVGKSVLLYRDPMVKFGQDETGGIRIKALSDMKVEIVVPVTKKRGIRVATRIERLIIDDNPPPKPADTPADIPFTLTDPEHLALAIVAARKGSDAFKAWWNTDAGKDARHVAKPVIAKLQAIAAEADKATQDDPFGLPPADSASPTAAEISAQMEAAAAEVRAAHDAEDGA